KLYLRLFVLARTARRVALERAFFQSTGELALPQLRRRQVRLAQAYAVQLQSRGDALRRSARSMAGEDRRRPQADQPLRGSRDRPALRADYAAAGRYRRLQGPLVPHLLLAA